MVRLRSGPLSGCCLGISARGGWPSLQIVDLNLGPPPPARFRPIKSEVVSAAPSVHAPPHPPLPPLLLPASARGSRLMKPGRLPVSPAMRLWEVDRQRAAGSSHALTQALTSKKAHSAPPSTAQTLHAARQTASPPDTSKQALEAEEKRRSDLLAWRIMTAARRAAGVGAGAPNPPLQRLLANGPTAFSDAIWPLGGKRAISSRAAYPDCPEIEAGDQSQASDGIADDRAPLSPQGGARARNALNEQQVRCGGRDSPPPAPGERSSGRRPCSEPADRSLAASNHTCEEHGQRRDRTNDFRRKCSDETSGLLKVSTSDFTQKSDSTLAQHSFKDEDHDVSKGKDTIDMNPIKDTSSTVQNPEELGALTSTGHDCALRDKQSAEQLDFIPISALTHKPLPKESNEIEVILPPHKREENKKSFQKVKIKYSLEKDFETDVGLNPHDQQSNPVGHTQIKSFPITQNPERLEIKNCLIPCEQFNSNSGQKENRNRNETKKVSLTNQNFNSDTNPAGDTLICSRAYNSKKKMKDETNQFERNKLLDDANSLLKCNVQSSMNKTNSMDGETQYQQEGNVKSSISNNSINSVSVHLQDTKPTRVELTKDTSQLTKNKQMKVKPKPREEILTVNAGLANSECLVQDKLKCNKQQANKVKIRSRNTITRRINPSQMDERHLTYHPNNDKLLINRNYPENKSTKTSPYFPIQEEKHVLKKGFHSNNKTKVLRKQNRHKEECKDKSEPLYINQNESRPRNNNTATVSVEFPNPSQQTQHRENGVDLNQFPKKGKRSPNLQIQPALNNTISNGIMRTDSRDILLEPSLNLPNQKRQRIPNSKRVTLNSEDPMGGSPQQNPPLRNSFEENTLEKSTKVKNNLEKKLEEKTLPRKDEVCNDWNANEEYRNKVASQKRVQSPTARISDQTFRDDNHRCDRHRHSRPVPSAPIPAGLPLAASHSPAAATARAATPQRRPPESSATTEVHSPRLESAARRRSARRHSGSPSARASAAARASAGASAGASARHWSTRDAIERARTARQRPASSPTATASPRALYRRYLRSARAWRPGAEAIACPTCGRRARPAPAPPPPRHEPASFADMCFSGCWSLVHLLRAPSPLRLHCRACGHFLGAYDPRRARLTPAPPTPARAFLAAPRRHTCSRSPTPARHLPLPARRSGRGKK